MRDVAAPFGARFLTPNGAATAAARAEQSRKRQCVGRMLEFQKFRACGAKIPETPTCTHALRMPQLVPCYKKEKNEKPQLPKKLFEFRFFHI